MNRAREPALTPKSKRVEKEALAKLMFERGKTVEKVRRVADKHFFCCPSVAVGLFMVADEMERMIA